MTDTLLPTATLIADAERAMHNVALFGTRYRTDLLTARNKLRARTAHLEERLTNADQMYPHRKEVPIPVPHERAYLDLLAEYERCHEAWHKADTAMKGA